MIYLNETFAVTAGAVETFARKFIDDLVPAMSRNGVEPLGLWQTWRTAELTTFWELPGNPALDALDAAMTEDEALARHTREADDLVLDKRVKILSATPFCPDLARIKAEGLKGGVYMLAVIPLVPERMGEYLELFPQFGLRFEHKYGLKTVGYWRGGGGEPQQSDSFTCTQLCAGESWEWWDSFNQQRAKDPEVRAWLERAIRYRGHHGYSYLIPRYLPY